jgi:hypothetical protein
MLRSRPGIQSLTGEDSFPRYDLPGTGFQHFLCRTAGNPGLISLGKLPEAMTWLRPRPLLEQPVRIDDVRRAKGGSYEKASY